MSADQPAHDYVVVSSSQAWTGRVTAIRSDVVRMPDGSTSQRDVVEHPGSVGVVALDDEDRVVLVQQYRHPLRTRLWEIPAGLRDVDGEAPAATAARELAEEARLSAGEWHWLVDVHTSPGMTDERIRVFLARDLAPIPESDAPAREMEELEMAVRTVALDEAVAAVLAGELTNGLLVSGVLAAAAARDGGWATLRPATAPW